MTVINYDKHVKNLIAGLSKSGHVTHSKWKKKSVTFHHNAGVNISHEGILGIWQHNPVSAHFDLDKNGDVAQYVEADEYAWAVGNTEGNEETISIELTNSTAGPHWEVSEITWKSGARLAGWLFVHEIKERPNAHNVLLHHHWSSTACPGPYVTKIYNDLLKAVQHWYEYFSKQQKPVATTPSEPVKKAVAKPHQNKNLTQSDVDKIKSIQKIFDLEPDGKWGATTDQKVLAFRKEHFNKF